jgi:hypothetical protein
MRHLGIINCSAHPCFPNVNCKNEKGAIKVELDGHFLGQQECINDRIEKVQRSLAHTH